MERQGLRGWIAAALALSVLAADASRAQAPTNTHLVIVVDGLRPDYITPDLMPCLFALGRRGIVFSAHHAIYPTVTRVNASSLVTGAYPETHGLLGNTIYIPSADPARGLDTGERANLERVAQAEGRLLTAPALTEILQRAGKRFLAVSSGSSGSAFLLNASAAGGGSTIHPEFARPPELMARTTAVLGPAPAKAMPNDAQNRFAIDGYLTVGLDELKPDVTFMWINDPDGTAHSTGIGSEMTRRALALVDAGIGRIEDTLRSKGLLDRTNILVTSDHGFSTHTGEFRLAALVAPFARKMADGSSDIVVAEGAVYLRSGDSPDRVTEIVAALQQRTEVGAIFTRPRTRGSSEGIAPGTLSFDVARWQHARAGAILVSANWTDAVNAAGVKGTTAQGGVAGHGTSSPYDIHNPLIAAGPDFRSGATSDVPTANADIAPTLLHLLGVTAPATMTGRVIREGLRTGPLPSTIRVTHSRETVRSRDGRYQLSAVISTAAGHTYLDYTEVVRAATPAPSKGPWFGIALPTGMGDLHEPVVTTKGINASNPRIPAGEEQRPALAGRAILRDLETIVAFSKASRDAGNRLWGRITGFPSQTATAKWAAGQFRAAGLQDAVVQEFSASAPMWWSRAWEVRLLAHPHLGPATTDVVLESAIPTSGSQIGGGTLTASLVYAGPTTAPLPAVDVAGKVAVQTLRPQSGAYSERGRTVDRARELMKRGAVAVLNAIEQPGNMHVRDFSSCGIPCFNIGGRDGAFVQSVIERAAAAGILDDVRVRLTLQSETLNGLTAQNAIATVPGVSSEVVIVNAHTDGWFDAAGDNGDGLAVLVALARHFAKPEHKPQRTLVFVASAGHHGTGLNGPSNFVKMNPRIGEKTVLVVNLEHVAQLRMAPAPWRVEPTEQPMNFGISNMAPALVDLGQRAMTRYGFNINPTFSTSIAGDLGGYAPLGVARLQAIHAGPLYHTSGDVLATISEPGLERAARFYAFFIAEAAKLAKPAINPEATKSR